MRHAALEISSPPLATAATAQLRIGIAVSRFNSDICEGLLAACLEALAEHGVPLEQVCVVRVPGALELPLVLGAWARQGGFDALIALGCVIRGETYHFEIVSDVSARSLAQLQLQHGLPIVNGVLTTEDEDQALVRMAEKGRDMAHVAIEMAALLHSLAHPSAPSVQP